MSIRWLLPRVVCWAQGHNLVGMDLPLGWSRQVCRTCGEEVDAHRPNRSARR